MPGLNKVMLRGNVGDQPEVRKTANGKSVTNISIATSENWKDASGQKQTRTEWHKVVFYGVQADIVGEHVNKGDKLYVEGSIRTNKWQDKSGQDRFTTEVAAKSLEFLTPKKGKTESKPFTVETAGPKVENPKVEFDEDDIPF